jgi:hypothetical protein
VPFNDDSMFQRAISLIDSNGVPYPWPVFNGVPRVNSTITDDSGTAASIANTLVSPSTYGLVTRNVDMSFDAFNRLRISEPFTLISGFNEYKINPFNFVTSTTGTGTVTHSTTTKRVTLATGGTASGARSVQQSRVYARYNPGKSLQMSVTAIPGAVPASGVAKRMGYFDDSNGIFLNYTSAGIALVLRSSVSGSIVDTSVAQASWNVDPMNGSGPSGLTLDMTKGQIFIVDLQYLGVGTVRCGFEINGLLYYVHFFHHSNLTSDQPYMATPNLPVRWEIVNTGTAGAVATMDAICCQVSSEGGFEPIGIQYSAENDVGIGLTTTLKPILSIRPGPTFGGITNRGWIIPKALSLYVDNNTSVIVKYQLIWNATLTGASWTAVNANAMGQFDVTATAVSLGSGVVIDRDTFASSSNSAKVGNLSNTAFSDRPLVNSFDGTTPDTLTIAARTVTGTATAAYASITWQGQW